MLLLSPLLLAQSKLKRIFSFFLFFFKEKSLQDPGETGIFYVDHFGCETPGKGSLFKALLPLGSNNETKCIALNSEKKFSLETFDKYSPHPDTIFLITKVD